MPINKITHVCLTHDKVRARNEKMLEDAKNGMSQEQLAEKYQICVSTVRYSLKDFYKEQARQRKTKKKAWQRFPRFPLSADVHQGLCGGHAGRHYPAGAPGKIRHQWNALLSDSSYARKEWPTNPQPKPYRDWQEKKRRDGQEIQKRRFCQRACGRIRAQKGKRISRYEAV